MNRYLKLAFCDVSADSPAAPSCLPPALFARSCGWLRLQLAACSCSSCLGACAAGRRPQLPRPAACACPASPPCHRRTQSAATWRAAARASSARRARTRTQLVPLPVRHARIFRSSRDSARQVESPTRATARCRLLRICTASTWVPCSVAARPGHRDVVRRLHLDALTLDHNGAPQTSRSRTPWPASPA